MKSLGVETNAFKAWPSNNGTAIPLPQGETTLPQIFSLAGDRIAVKLAKVGEKPTKGGILLPETHDKRIDSARGEVVAFGPGYFTHFGVFLEVRSLVPGLELGARIVFARNGGTEAPLMIDGDEYVVIRSGEVIGVLAPEKAAT